MNRMERMHALLTEELHPTILEIHDDSAQHAGHSGAREGGETHYTIMIQSKDFQCLSKIQSHQIIYRLLDSEFKSGLHALSIIIK